jgi:hypothetical protein
MNDKINIEQLIEIGSGEIFGYIAKGHFDADEFCKQVFAEYEEEIMPEKIEYVLSRKVPCNNGDVTWRFDIVKEHGFGVAEYTYFKCEL